MGAVTGIGLTEPTRRHGSEPDALSGAASPRTRSCVAWWRTSLWIGGRFSRSRAGWFARILMMRECTWMRKRHEIWKQEYPDRPTKRGAPFTGIANVRDATRALSDPPVDLENLPFDSSGIVTTICLGTALTPTDSRHSDRR